MFYNKEKYFSVVDLQNIDAAIISDTSHGESTIASTFNLVTLGTNLTFLFFFKINV